MTRRIRRNHSPAFKAKVALARSKGRRHAGRAFYLLRQLKIDRPNQVWGMDITYIPMAKGFVYLAAVISSEWTMIFSISPRSMVNLSISMNEWAVRSEPS